MGTSSEVVLTARNFSDFYETAVTSEAIGGPPKKRVLLRLHSSQVTKSLKLLVRARAAAVKTGCPVLIGADGQAVRQAPSPSPFARTSMQVR